MTRGAPAAPGTSGRSGPHTPPVRRAGVVGHPVAHSLSPVLHGAAYRTLGLDGWSYDAIDVPDGELAAWLSGCGPEWAGLSVTMPHKKAALALADVTDPLAATVGAANTLVLQGAGAGRLVVAANTDVHGVAQAVREVRGADPATSAVVLGAGGTAAAGLAALAELGVTSPVVCVRSSARAADLLQAAHRMGVDVTLRRFDQAARFILGADIVLQTAVAGAADPVAAGLTAELARSGARLRPDQVLLDAIYDPWPTALARAWEDCGGCVAPGWLMLLHQAVEQVRLMTGVPAPVDAMRAALVAALP